MMWFGFSLIALLCWSGSDLLSKLGCQQARDPYSHLKMTGAVGLVMGLHAVYTLTVSGVMLTWQTIMTYLPVSAMYIASMTVGYWGMRYIELSILSPVCNSSGAIVVILLLLTGGWDDSFSGLTLLAVGLVCGGMIGLGITEATENEERRRARQDRASRRYTKSVPALALPLLYCLLDALGTFMDSRVLETLDEDQANVAYELTFLAVGLVCLAYVGLVRRRSFHVREEAPKYAAAVLETAGQFFYIYALADTRHAAFTVPIISAYCAVSVLWGRVFLKERLSAKHYVCLVSTILGIVLLGMLDV